MDADGIPVAYFEQPAVWNHTCRFGPLMQGITRPGKGGESEELGALWRYGVRGDARNAVIRSPCRNGSCSSGGFVSRLKQ